MAGGRPPKGPELVEGLDGSSEAKKKLKVILETVSGKKTIGDACTELGIGEAMFHALRERTLREAVAGLEPRPSGRPAKEIGIEKSRVEDLEEEIKKLKRELQISHTREEIAMSMPGFYVKEKGTGKKTKR